MTTYKYCILLLTVVVSFSRCPVCKFNLIISTYEQEETHMGQVHRALWCWHPLEVLRASFLSGSRDAIQRNLLEINHSPVLRKAAFHDGSPKGMNLRGSQSREHLWNERLDTSKEEKENPDSMGKMWTSVTSSCLAYAWWLLPCLYGDDQVVPCSAHGTGPLESLSSSILSRSGTHETWLLGGRKAVGFLILILLSVFYKKPRKSCPCSEQKKHVGTAIQSTTMAKASDHQPDCLPCSVCNTQRTTDPLHCFEGGFPKKKAL